MIGSDVELSTHARMTNQVRDVARVTRTHIFFPTLDLLVPDFNSSKGIRAGFILEGEGEGGGDGERRREGG